MPNHTPTHKPLLEATQHSSQTKTIRSTCHTERNGMSSTPNSKVWRDDTEMSSDQSTAETKGQQRKGALEAREERVLPNHDSKSTGVLENSEKSEDKVRLIPSDQKKLCARAKSSVSKNSFAADSIDADIFSFSNSDTSSMLSNSHQNSKQNLQRKLAHKLKRQRSLPVTSFEHLLHQLKHQLASTCSPDKQIFEIANGGRESPPLPSYFNNNANESSPPLHSSESGISRQICFVSNNFRDEEQRDVDKECQANASQLDSRSADEETPAAILLHRRVHKKATEESGSEIASNSDAGLKRRRQISYLLYLSTFAVLGSITRVYVARFFGEDCEDHNIEDFLTPLSSQICVTAGGASLQTGGALFRDLPANMIGSFVMGLVTPKDSEPSSLRLPWFHSDHPRQKDDVLHAAYTVGFCGSLTTFASWNTQMVVMMYGRQTQLGPQVIPALAGYLLGLITAVASFHFGRQCSSWLQAWKANHVKPECDVIEHEIEGGSSGNPFQRSATSLSGSNAGPEGRRLLSLLSFISPKRLTALFAATLLVIFIVAYQVFGIVFYKNLFFVCLFTPPGVILRWNLSTWNSRRGGLDFLAWVPLGTFTANILASLVSITCASLIYRFQTQQSDIHGWVIPLLDAAKVGFAGSLSTVSSMAKEIVVLSEKHPGHAKPHFYGIMTVTVAMVLSLCLYVAIEASG